MSESEESSAGKHEGVSRAGKEQPGDLALSENLGRGVFSSKDADRARRAGIPKRVFVHKGMTEISVDRLDLMSEEEAINIARMVAEGRGRDGPRRSFYGWAVLVAENACRSGRCVRASPIEDNRYHADITLPTLAGEDDEEHIRHAQELADDSHWREPSPRH